MGIVALLPAALCAYRCWDLYKQDPMDYVAWGRTGMWGVASLAALIAMVW